jgi:hypothetical protein
VANVEDTMRLRIELLSIKYALSLIVQGAARVL